MQLSWKTHTNNLSSPALFYGVLAISFFLSLTISAFMVNSAMKNTILGLQKKTSMAEVSVTANYFEQFLSARLKSLQDLSRYAMIINALMHTDTTHSATDNDSAEFLSEFTVASLSDFLDRYQILGQKERMKVVSRDGTEVYSNFDTPNKYSANITEEKWFQTVISGEAPSSTLLVDYEDSHFFQITVPITYNDNVEGVIITQFYSDISDLFQSLGHDSQTAIKLRGRWNDQYKSVDNLDDHYTLVQKSPIKNTGMSLEYYVSQTYLDKQAREFTQGVTLSVLLSVFLSFAMLSFLGKKLVLNPFEMLAASEKELRQSQDELTIAKAKAEQANIAKGDFLANMSHELRTPMNAIMGLADILMDSKLSADDKESVTTIYNSSGQMIYLLNDLLDFSKIEQGQIEIERINFNLSDELTALKNLFSAIADKKAIDLNFHIDEELPAYFHGDINHIRQVLHNLIGNALKFTDKGQVTVKAYRPDPNDINMIRIEVTDTGIGISEDEAHKVFEKFSQADASISRRFGGTGLGLPISKKLAEIMGGTVDFSSKKGKGSCFWIDVPLMNMDADAIRESEEDTDETADSLQTQTFGHVKLLVVDDHPVNLIFMRKLLRKLEIKDFLEASSGEEAVKIMKEEELDAVLMDCHLPEISGMEATRQIRDFEKEMGKDELPIVAVTADVLEDTKKKCFEAGMKHYLTKPVTKANLQQILSDIFGDNLHAPKTETHSNETTDNDMNEETTPVDLGHLRDFTDGDPEEEKEFFEIYLKQSEIIIDTLEGSLEDNKEWEDAAHKLKGASANLGANRLANICSEAEDKYKAPKEQKTELLKAIKEELSRVEVFINSLHDS